MRALLQCLAATCCIGTLNAQQVADTVFRPPLGAPDFAGGQGPVVLIDEAHHNFHTAEGRYSPFARLVRRDGYVVRPSRSHFDAASLKPAKVLVIANALAAANETNWTVPTPSAFDAAEIRAVHEWVEDGGSLLLIADHLPFGGAAAQLAASFGVDFSNGFVLDTSITRGLITFHRSGGALASNPITEGRNAAERIDSITTFTGQGFRLETAGAPLLTIPAGWVLYTPDTAWRFSSATPRKSAAGLLQGAVLRVGKGRVAVFGEAAMFSAQVSGPARRPMGFNAPEAAQNAQFVLNVLHWLSGLLGDSLPQSASAMQPASDTTLRNELLRIGEEDQSGREDLMAAVARKDTATLFRFMRADSAHTRRLQQIVARYGWPTSALVGRKAVSAAWLILQHSPDNAWQEKMLPALQRAAVAGDFSQTELALFTDRLLVHQGKPQHYGNSFSMKDGRLVPDPIDDLTGLDARRAAIGLPPMAEYARELGDAYHVPVVWPPK
jgi:hypothetical protein